MNRELKIPLHLDPADKSALAEQRRYDLHLKMTALNPTGFRRESTRLRRIANRAFGLVSPPSPSQEKYYD